MSGEKSEIDLVVLNTNLYYTNNEKTVDMPDPANQLQWLDDLLTLKATEQRKVYTYSDLRSNQSS